MIVTFIEPTEDVDQEVRTFECSCGYAERQKVKFR